MDKKNDTNAVAPWHTGVIEASATGAGLTLVAGAGTLVGIGVAFTGHPWIGGAISTTSAVIASVGAIATVGKLLEEREKYHQAHSSVNASSAQHQGVVSPTQQVAATR